MRALLTFYFEGPLVKKALTVEEVKGKKTEKTVNDYEYQLDITVNGVTTRVEKIKAQELINDTKPLNCLALISISLIRITRGWMGKVEEKVIEKVHYKFTRRINMKLSFKLDKKLGSEFSDEFLSHPQIECATAGFKYPPCDLILGESPLEWVRVEDPCLFTDYFQAFNIDQLRLARERDDGFVVHLRVYSICNDVVDDDEFPQKFRVFYQTILQRTEYFPVHPSATLDLPSGESDDYDDESSELSESKDDEEEIPKKEEQAETPEASLIDL